MLTLMRPFLRSYMSRASGKLCTGCHSCACTLVSSLLLPQEVRQEVEKEGLCAAVRDLPSRGCGMDGGASAPLIGFAKIPLSCAKAAGGNGAWSSRCLRGSAGMRGSCDISVTGSRAEKLSSEPSHRHLMQAPQPISLCVGHRSCKDRTQQRLRMFGPRQKLLSRAVILCA